jgi:hypothetical protein
MNVLFYRTIGDAVMKPGGIARQSFAGLAMVIISGDKLIVTESLERPSHGNFHRDMSREFVNPDSPNFANQMQSPSQNTRDLVRRLTQESTYWTNGGEEEVSLLISDFRAIAIPNSLYLVGMRRIERYLK